jgi:sugar phosphate isomerase/epimerase
MNKIKQKIDVFDEVTFHLPYSSTSFIETKKTIEIAESLGIKLFVLHPNLSREEIISLITFCKGNGLVLCLENMPLEQADYHEPKEFDYFVEKGGFLTLDTGHAVVCGIDPLIFVERFKDKIKHVHLQDGLKGKPDMHYAIGNGELDYANFLKKMKEIDYKGIIMLELVSEEDVKISMERIRKHL